LQRTVASGTPDKSTPMNVLNGLMSYMASSKPSKTVGLNQRLLYSPYG